MECLLGSKLFFSHHFILIRNSYRVMLLHSSVINMRTGKSIGAVGLARATANIELLFILPPRDLHLIWDSIFSLFYFQSDENQFSGGGNPFSIELKFTGLMDR